MAASRYIKVSTLSMPTRYFKALERCLAKVDLKNHSQDFEMLFHIYKTLREHHTKKKTVVKVKPVKKVRK